MSALTPEQRTVAARMLHQQRRDRLPNDRPIDIVHRLEVVAALSTVDSVTATAFPTAADYAAVSRWAGDLADRVLDTTLAHLRSRS